MIKVEKAWVIVYRLERGQLELLALQPNPEPGRSTKPYVVTGGIEVNETPIQAAGREVNEEIGIEPVLISDLGETIHYTDDILGEVITEYCFAAEIPIGDLILNEEHIGYEWLGEHTFINTIWWEESKDKLHAFIARIQNIIEQQ
jgi:8-oxo-dGTP pyrophosphatase MutT (NUDIX family)